MNDLGTEQNPLRVAIVGSGPSGFYAAEALFRSDRVVDVHMFERLPCPYGLVRLGVAPDHPKIKTAIRVYEKIAANPRFRYWGNVTVGRDFTVDDLRRHYDAAIFAHGADTDRALNIPGEDLPGSHAATEFVAWYNGHPDYRDSTFDLSQEAVAVIGQGNVAVDVCRILLKTVDELKETDIASYALEALAESRVRAVHMIGRRGPAQAKFTALELKELGSLAACAAVVDPADLVLDPLSEAEFKDPSNKSASKLIPILRAFAERNDADKPRKLYFHFLRSPEAVLGGDRVEGLVLRHNRLVGEPFSLRAEATEETEELACGLVFRSVGYRGSPLEGLPFDAKREIVPNTRGRVSDGGKAVPGLYVTGWIKRGPTGVIGTNKPDSAETVESLLADVASNGRNGIIACEDRSDTSVAEVLEERGVRYVTYDEWQKIDAAEIARGAAVGKPREKFTRISEMLAATGADS